MSTLAVVIFCVAEEDPGPALRSADFADEVHVVSDSVDVVRGVEQLGGVGHLTPRPSCIEEIGGLLLELSRCAWMLLLDPDERVHADEGLLRRRLADAEPSVAAFDVNYTLSLFGADLTLTYDGLRKTKLLRTGRCHWPNVVHALPTPAAAGDRVEWLNPDALSVASDLGEDLRRRLERHAQWAHLESKEASAPVGVDRLLDALSGPMLEYVRDRHCLDDGTNGLAVAMLHVAKEIYRALFEASRLGFRDPTESDRERLRRLLSSLDDR
jgi:hypothetical protein